MPRAGNKPPVFLERGNYRNRRFKDAARAVPLCGGVLVMLPMIWPQGGEGVSTVRAVLYIFGVWAIMIAVAFALARWQPKRGEEE